MTNTVLLGATLAAVLAISMTAYAFAAPSWTTAAFDADEDITQVGNITKLSLTADDTIPKRADDFVNANAVVGFAWADLDALELVVATIHPQLGRDSHQNPDAWHIHTATLTTSTGSLCVESINSTPEAGISIKGDRMTVNLQNADLPYDVSDIDGAVGFTLNGASTTVCPALLDLDGDGTPETGVIVGLL